MPTRRYVTHLVEALGINRCYHGHDLALEAILAVLRDEETLHNLRRSVYIPMAEQRGCHWRCVERCVRTAVQRAWLINEAQLRQMTPYPLDVAPTVKEFIEIMATYTLRNAPAEVLSEISGWTVADSETSLSSLKELSDSTLVDEKICLC